MDHTAFTIPTSEVLAIASLKALSTYCSHVVINGVDGRMSLASNEDEAYEIANPDNGDCFFPVGQLIEELQARATN